jgi:hypothetical protein
LLKERATVLDRTLVFVDDEGVEFMKLCVDVTLYWKGTAHEHRDGILHFYSEAMNSIRSRVRFYETEDMEGAVPVSSGTFDELPSWLASSGPAKDVASLHLYAGTVPNLPSDVAFQFQAEVPPEGDAVGMVRMVLPATTVESSGEPLLERALTLGAALRFHSGYAGYAIHWDPLGELAFDAQTRMGILARRYPAIELPEVTATLMAIPSGMKRINWLSFVGDELMSDKGLLPEALAQLDTRRLQHGVAIVAGPRPLLGDVNRQEDLGTYHKVGRVLAPLRSVEHIPFIWDRDGEHSEQLTEEWLGYFDE